MPARLTILFLVVILFAPLSGCGQKGPLYIPPTCSPVAADGTVRERTDEDGNVLPPCPREVPEEATDADQMNPEQTNDNDPLNDELDD